MSTNSATPFAGPMDTEDSVDYVGEFDLLLEAGETILAGFTVSPTTESAALGFEIDTGAKLPVLETGDQKVLFWGKVASPLCLGTGMICTSVVVSDTSSPQQKLYHLSLSLPDFR